MALKRIYLPALLAAAGLCFAQGAGAAEADPCELAKSGSVAGAFTKFKLSELDHASLSRALSGKTTLEVDESGNCQYVSYKYGGRMAMACKDEHIRAGLEAVCRGRAANVEAKKQEVKRKALKLGSDLEHRRLDSELIDRYKEFVESDAPKELKDPIDEAYREALIKHMGRNKYDADGKEPEATALDQKAYSAWLQRQNPEDKDALKTKMAGLDKQVDDYQGTLRMQDEAAERRREYEMQQERIQAIKDKKAKEAAKTKERIRKCAELEQEYGNCTGSVFDPSPCKVGLAEMKRLGCK